VRVRRQPLGPADVVDLIERAELEVH
jgi:hypothetical protein